MNIQALIRNARLFGWRQYAPTGRKKYAYIFGLVLLVVVFGLARMFDGSDGSVETIPVTGAAVSELPQEEVSVAEQRSTSAGASAQGVTASQSEEESPAFYEYDTQCAYKVKQVQDDLTDIQAYLSEDASVYDTLVKEREEKLVSIQKEYDWKIELAKKKVEEAQQHLESAEERLEETEVECKPLA